MNYIETDPGLSHFHRFLSNYSGATQRIYKSEISQFFTWLEAGLEAITPNTLHEYNALLIEAGFTHGTIKRKLSNLNSFLKHLESNYPAFTNPMGEYGKLQTFHNESYIDSDKFHRDLGQFMKTLSAENTKRSYQKNLEWAFQYFRKSPNTLNQWDFIQYRDHLLNEAGLKNSTVMIRFAALNKFFTFLQMRSAGKFSNPLHMKTLELEKGSHDDNFRRNLLTDDEVRRLLAAPDRYTLIGKRDYLTLCLLANYGLRISEAARLKFSDFTPADGDKIMMVIRDRKGKRGRRRSTDMFLEGAPLDAFKDWLQSSRYTDPGLPVIQPFRYDLKKKDVFIDQEKLVNTERRANSTIERIFSTNIARAGINAMGRTLTPHILRHKLTSDLVKSGVLPPEIQYFLGHNSLESQRAYTHVYQTPSDHVAMKSPFINLP